MPKREIHSPLVAKPTNPHAQAVVGGNLFFTASCSIGVDGKVVGVGDVTAQTRQTLDNIKALIEAAGGSMTDICRVMIYLTDRANFAAMNAVYRDYFPSQQPSRATVIADLGMPELLVELDIIAVLA